MCLHVGVCEYERAGAAAVCGTEVGVGDVVGAVRVADNELGEKGGTEVAKALLKNTTLTELDLGRRGLPLLGVLFSLCCKDGRWLRASSAAAGSCFGSMTSKWAMTAA